MKVMHVPHREGHIKVKVMHVLAGYRRERYGANDTLLETSVVRLKVIVKVLAKVSFKIKIFSYLD